MRGLRRILPAVVLVGVALRLAASQATVFFEDFAGPELDRSRWNVEVTGRTVNNEQQAYVDSTETIALVTGPQASGAANALRLRPLHRPGFKTSDGRSFDFLSGRINTRDKFEFTYGTAAARMKLASGAGLWPAFWALGTGPWPATGEIDVMENVGERDWTSVALHGPGYSGDTPLVKRQPFAAPDNITNWHVYSVDWAPDELVFKVDDVEIYRVTRAMVEKYGRWAFDNPKFLILNLALGGGFPNAVNRVKSPYFGLPESTVELIKRGDAVTLVDWVRVTQR
jgi:beta-glucanase (GH16 family)